MADPDVEDFKKELAEHREKLAKAKLPWVASEGTVYEVALPPDLPRNVRVVIDAEDVPLGPAICRCEAPGDPARAEKLAKLIAATVNTAPWYLSLIEEQLNQEGKQQEWFDGHRQDQGERIRQLIDQADGLTAAVNGVLLGVGPVVDVLDETEAKLALEDDDTVMVKVGKLRKLREQTQRALKRIR